MNQQFEIYTSSDGSTQVEVKFEGETFWLSQEQLSDLFERDQSVISRHLSNVFKDDQLHHVVIVYSQAISGEIEFNHNLSGSVSALYQYIALYQDAFNSTQALNHYSLWMNRDVKTISDNSTYSISIAEDEAEYFDNVWLLVQNS